MRIELTGSTAGQAGPIRERWSSVAVRDLGTKGRDLECLDRRTAGGGAGSVKNSTPRCSAIPLPSVAGTPSSAPRRTQRKRLTVSASAEPSTRVQWAAIRA